MTDDRFGDRTHTTPEADADEDRVKGWAGVPDAAGVGGEARDDLDSTLRPASDEGADRREEERP